MAEAVARGAGEIEHTWVELKRAGDTRMEDLVLCDGLAIGSPEYFGYMAGAVKDLFDRTYEPLRGHRRVFRKPYCVFISAGNDGQGALNHIERICMGYQFKKVLPPIISKGDLTEAVLAQCHEMGKTIAAGCDAGIY
jgi:multimeric flavodoxin WrbA